jgi:alpha-tubulin suppressor-like RCC1 family protein
MRPFACLLPFVLGAFACSTEGVLGSLRRPEDVPPTDAGVDGAIAEPTPAPDLGLPTPSTIPVGAGGVSTCVRTAVRTVECWGSNAQGGLGVNDLSVDSSETPLTVTDLEDVTAIASGQLAHCAIQATGKLRCWGYLFTTSIPDLPAGSRSVFHPTEMPVRNDVVRVAVGLAFVCTVHATGELRCWGENDVGQLGTGDMKSQALPTLVMGASDAVTSVAASMGGTFACATTRSGAVFCWGAAGAVLGVSEPVLTPRQVLGLPEPAVEVTAGRAHACARLRSGAVSCWGANEEGQLGAGDEALHADPVTVDVSDVVQVAAGADHACAVRNDGSLVCWGHHYVPTHDSPSRTNHSRLIFPASRAIAAVSCGMAHSCVWSPGGDIECWGVPLDGRLGPRTGTF